MRTFEHFNASTVPCPICGTKEDKPPVLIPIDGTGDGKIAEAIQVHLDCIELRAKRNFDGYCTLLYQQIPDKQRRTNDLQRLPQAR